MNKIVKVLQMILTNNKTNSNSSNKLNKESNKATALINKGVLCCHKNR